MELYTILYTFLCIFKIDVETEQCVRLSCSILTTNMGIKNLIQIPTQEIAYTIANKPEPNLKVHPGQNIRYERDTLLNLHM